MDNWEPWFFACVECGKKMDERTERLWTKVEGWERKRKQGGTNHLALRRPVEEFMCEACMILRQRNIDPRQTSLLA